MGTLKNYIVHCPIENILFDDLNRPYEQTPLGRVYLSLKKESVLTSYNSRN